MALYLKPANVIEARLGINANGRVQNYFAERVAIHSDKYVPMETGNLRDYRIEGSYIFYEQPYATYQYYGVREDGTHKINPANRNRSKHPLATTYWDRVMWSTERPVIVKEVQNYVDKGRK